MSRWYSGFWVGVAVILSIVVVAVGYPALQVRFGFPASSTAFLVVAIVSALWGVVCFILMAVALEQRGVHVNMVLARVFFFRYLNEYKNVTRRETGRVGQLYYSYIVAMNVALVCAIIALVLRFIR